MATDIELNTKINIANSAKSLGELRGGLKELIALQSQVASGSANFEKLSKAINDTEGRIGDLNDSFTTLRGSGVERLNSSLGLLKEGLLGGDVDKAKIAFKGLGSAMSAIPIFLVVEGLKALYDNFDKIVPAIKDFFNIASDTQKEMNALTKEIEAQKKADELLFVQMENNIKVLEAQGASEKEIIKAKKELTDLKIKEAQADITLQQLKAKDVIMNDSVTESVYRGISAVLRKTGKDKEADAIDMQITKSKQERIKELNDAITKDAIAIENLRNTQQVEEIKIEKKKNDEFKKLAKEKEKDDEERRKKQLDAFNASLEEDDKALEKQQADQAKKEEERQKKADEFTANQDKFLEDQAKKEIGLYEEVQKQKDSMRARDLAEEQAIQNAKFQIASNAITSIAGLSDIAFSIRQANTKKGSAEEEKSARKQFQVNKALQIASATISGAQGVLNAATQPSGVPIPFDIPFRVAKAIAIGATTGATIAKISATQFQSAGGGSSGSASIGGGASTPSPVGGGATVPLSNVRATNFKQDSVGQVGGPGGSNTPGNNNFTKVVLLEGDVTRVQNKVSLTESQAKF